MKKINDVASAIAIFEEAAIKHAEATEIGDYKTGNKNYSMIVKAGTFIREQNEIDKLLVFLNHNSVGVRLWAASYLLSEYTNEAEIVLENISKTNGIQSLIAETTLTEWRKGNLKL